MERLFGLDMQLIADTLLTAISVFVLFTLASYLFFDTVRDVLKKRQDRIKKNPTRFAIRRSTSRNCAMRIRKWRRS